MDSPVEQVLEEAKSIRPDAMQKGRIQCLISIGTGVLDLKEFGDNLKQVAKTLVSIATETEDTERRFYSNHKDLGLTGRYFRFNVDRGLADIQLDDHIKIPAIEVSAEEYLGAPRTKELVHNFLAARAPLLDTSIANQLRLLHIWEDGFELDSYRRAKNGPSFAIFAREDSTKKGYFRVPKTFHHLFTKYSHSQYPLEEWVDATLVDLLKEFKRTFIIVNALDEFPNLTAPSMGNYRGVIKFLDELRQRSHDSTHVLITSRREPEIEAAVQDIAAQKTTVPMNTAVVKADMKAFLADSLRKDPFKDWPTKLKKRVVRTLVDNSDGVFRWAVLKLLVLMKEDRPQDVEIALKLLPKDLEQTYERILTGIEN
ncbi:uncharacterized protein DNG_07246 [Cephalotrichum gorgonifer]|uniref:Uncharacterized protein n=1 Tax=Cephalotrichum gorgonifer TaxID=2041049 RepID=A0AAE8SX78_9PEZI|nr:uncharacterized protein DNG_07246 [Cephalotrichum gorgonifer]